ncbi:MAG: TetR/AcrR family transcriptional regulator [Bacteroidetes bacterium]|nr:MAG: TetR/AcrR family transcriptional regulator [Bacteroidota bacterium]
MIENKEIWIKTGYEIFAISGQNALKIEPLAKKVGISKSSFYHHFADLDIFIDFLLKHHIQQSYMIAKKEHNAKNIDPELIDILVAHKIDLLFNRQLRINRNIQSFANILSQSNKIVGDGFVMIWVKDLNLQLSQKQLEGIFELALENFYLQINLENLNHRWLAEYFANLKEITKKFV